MATVSPAASPVRPGLVSWLIGAAAIIVLAVVHAELGAAYPVAGGTGRFPHYAFDTVAGTSFGWFSWLQAVTVAPIEVMATLNYAAVHLPWLQHAKNQLTPRGYAVAVGLLALFVAINFLGIRLLAHTNSAATWWKVGVPLFTILVLAVTHFHGGNFGFGGFAPFGVRSILSAVSTSGIVFALLGFEQADQLAGESRNPARDIPPAVIGAIVLGAAIYVLLQVVFIAALPRSAFATAGPTSPSPARLGRSRAWPRPSGWAGSPPCRSRPGRSWSASSPPPAC